MSSAIESRSGESPPDIVRDNPILRRKVWGKMHLRNDNWMASVVGETGSGKSWAAIRIAEAVDPNFTVDQIAFSVREFLELVNDDSLGRGSVIVFEEASVEASAYEWYSQSNQVLGNVLDTWRHQNRGAIFTLPAFGLLQKRARGRMSALIQMHHKDEAEGYTLAKYKRCQQDTDTGKIYKKYPRLGGKKYKFLKLNRPSEELREAYEERKKEYTENLNQELLEELIEEEEGQDDDDDGEMDDPKEIAQDIIDSGEVDRYIADANGQRYINRNLIKVEYDIGEQKAGDVKALLLPEVGDDVV